MTASTVGITARPTAANLVAILDVEAFGGSELRLIRPADSEPLLIIRQSTGQTRTRLRRDQRVNPDGCEHQHCVTAIDLTGRVQWQFGAPHRHPDPYNGHGAGDLTVADIDADGRLEVLAVEVDRLVVLDALTGAQRASLPLPADNFSVLHTGRMLPGDPRCQIIVKNNEAPYPGYEYGNPTLILDADLKLLHTFDHVHGAGHKPVCCDIDGDGCDELLIGYSLVRRVRDVAWTIPVPNATQDHADHILPFRTDDGSGVRIAYSGSKDFFVVDPAGQVVWNRPHEHSQNCMIASLRPQQRCLILNEKWIGMTCYTLDGEALWRQGGVGYATHALCGWRADGLDLIVHRPSLTQRGRATPYPSDPDWSRIGWPRILDPTGGDTGLLPWSDDYRQPSVTIRSPLPYDYGVGYAALAADLDGDGRDELLIHDRRRVMVFAAPGASALRA